MCARGEGEGVCVCARGECEGVCVGESVKVCVEGGLHTLNTH